LELYDLPGRETFMVLNRMYLRDTNAALIVYDVNEAKSLKDAELWISEL
jgi:GTPase SAR1 family protein